jgi:hypothetical protein
MHDFNPAGKKEGPMIYNERERERERSLSVNVRYIQDDCKKNFFFVFCICPFDRVS